ncbi:MAG: SIS domain-containing protein [Nitrososphaerales archaeon]
MLLKVKIRLAPVVSTQIFATKKIEGLGSFLVKGFYETIRQMEAQVDELRNVKSSRARLDPGKVIFSGSGDSLACALFVQAQSNYKVRAIDPYDLTLSPGLAKGKVVCFISISGKTVTNVLASKLVEKNGALETIAITREQNSPLAKSCSKTILLDFLKSKEKTPGTNSFTSSLLTCASLIRKIPPRLKVEPIIESAKQWAKASTDKLDPRAAIHFVGSGPFFGIAMYGMAKIVEFSGTRASCQSLEQFSHMDLFSLGSKDLVFVLRNSKNEEKATLLDGYLRESKFQSLLVPFPILEKCDPVELAIWYSIHLQYLGLECALKRGYKAPAFLSNRDVLNISNNMIY